jgi:hypothetical protein
MGTKATNASNSVDPIHSLAPVSVYDDQIRVTEWNCGQRIGPQSPPARNHLLLRGCLVPLREWLLTIATIFAAKCDWNDPVAKLTEA